MKNPRTVLIQTALEHLGFNPGKIDGEWGPKTQAAFLKYSESYESGQLTQFDERTEKNLSTLLPTVQSVARKFIVALLDQGFDAKIISGTRTYTEQDDLYSQGRTQPGEKVTNARGGYSNHNFGIAFDIGLFNGKDYLEESPLYDKAGLIGKSFGLSWGGDWSGFQDKPHYELRPSWSKKMSENDMLSELRSRSKRGIEVF